VVARSLASRSAASFVKASGRAATPVNVGNSSGLIHDWQEVRRKVWQMKQAPQSRPSPPRRSVHKRLQWPASFSRVPRLPVPDNGLTRRLKDRCFRCLAKDIWSPIAVTR
jgi:hypothetical protein